MKTFSVYSHPTKGFEAVKVGFSWPGFFFNFIWLLVKNLWGWALIWFVYIILVNVFNLVALDSTNSVGINLFLSLIGLIASLMIFLLPGFKGNSWRVKKLGKRGYELVESVEASSPDTAIAQVAKTS